MPSSSQEPQSVWLALDLNPFQGQELLGVYTSREKAQARLAGLRNTTKPGEADRHTVLELVLDEPVVEWMGG